MNKQKKKKKKKNSVYTAPVAAIGAPRRSGEKHFQHSFVLPLVRIYSFLGQAWAEGKGELATSRRARTADRKGKLGKMYAAMIYIEVACEYE